MLKRWMFIVLFFSRGLFAEEYPNDLKNWEFGKENSEINSMKPKTDSSSRLGMYAFEGIHFIANYSGCAAGTLEDVATLESVFLDAIDASGATILNAVSHSFPGGGFTLVAMLSESHASIHTYPEHNACFIDLFTCGTGCSFESFDYFLGEYLRPEKAKIKVLYRKEEINDLSK